MALIPSGTPDRHTPAVRLTFLYIEPKSVRGDAFMRHFRFTMLLASWVLLLPATVGAQQLSPRAAAVLSQEGRLGFGENRIEIGPSSRLDRTAMLRQCEAQLGDYLSSARIAQMGEANLVRGAADVLAEAVRQLAEARSNASALATLQERISFYSNDAKRESAYRSEPALIACFLSEARRLVGRASPPQVASPPALGANASQVLQIEAVGGMQAHPETRADRVEMLRQCQPLVDARFRSGRDGGRPVTSVAKLLLSATTALTQARQGDATSLNYEVKTLYNQDGVHDPELLELGMCFMRAGRKILAGAASSQSASPTAPAAAPQAPVPASAPSTTRLSDEDRIAWATAINAEISAFRARYPVNAAWDAQQIHQYNIFFGTYFLDYLQRNKPHMDRDDNERFTRTATATRNSGLAGCPDCKAEYPGAPKPTPPAMPLRLAGVYGTGCVTPTIRNIRKPAEANPLPTIWVGDWVLSNKCATGQWVRIEAGSGHLFWPGLQTPGARMQPSPRRVPPLPFQPIQELHFGFGWYVPGNSEIVTDNGIRVFTDTPVDIWIASCAGGADGTWQAIYLSAPFRNNPKAVCYNHSLPNGGNETP